MASIQFIQNRIAGKSKEISNIQKKLDRIYKAKDSGWKINPYDYDESDLRYALLDLKEAENRLEKYRQDLATAQEKQNSRNIAPIIEFLNYWKKRCTEFYEDGIRQYYAQKDQVDRYYNLMSGCSYTSSEYETAKCKYETARETLHNKVYGYYETITYTDGHGRLRTNTRKVRDGEFDYVRNYISAKSASDAMKKLADDLNSEAIRKYDFIIERTNAIVGQITDASNLSIGDAHELNGIIVGTKGTANVRTIGAGGYNIQCFHFRTLITRVK